MRVVLQSGYSLSSPISLGGNTFTIEQLIQREIRRAICQQPFGATLTTDILTGEILNSQILLSAIQTQLDESLGTSLSTGTLGAYLKNRVIYIKDNTNNYTQPASIEVILGIPTLSTGDLPWVYDISTDPDFIYPNIGVYVA